MDHITICTYDERLIPEKKTLGAVCRDLKIAQKLVINPQELLVVGTGVKISLPLGRHTKVYARGGLPSKSGLMLANSVAVIDSDYRGEYFLSLYNFTTEPQTFKAYTRLAQFEIMPTYTAQYTGVVPEITFLIDPKTYDDFTQTFPSERGEGAFHSTGMH